MHCVRFAVVASLGLGAAHAIAQPFLSFKRKTNYFAALQQTPLFAMTTPSGHFLHVGTYSDGTAYAVTHSRSGAVTTQGLLTWPGGLSAFYPFAVTTNGDNIFIVGEGILGGRSDLDVVVFVLSPSGSILNTRFYDVVGSQRDNRPRHATVSPTTGDLFICGNTVTASSPRAPFLMRIDKTTMSTVFVQSGIGSSEGSSERVTVNAANEAFVAYLEGNNSAVLKFGEFGGSGYSFLLPNVTLFDLSVDASNRVVYAGRDSLAGKGTLGLLDPAGASLGSRASAFDGGYVRLARRNAQLAILGVGIGGTNGYSERINEGNVTALWTRSFIPATPNLFVPIDQSVDAFGEQVILGTTIDASGSRFTMHKNNAVGTARWSTTWSPSEGDAAGRAIAQHDASGDLFVVSAFNGVQRLAIYRQAPVAMPDIYYVPRNATYTSTKTVTTNDRYWMGSTVSLDSGPSSGTLTMNSNGTFTFTPAPGFTGNVTFRYKLLKVGTTLPGSFAQVTIVVV